jgi:hypothetical protein
MACLLAGHAPLATGQDRGQPQRISTANAQENIIQACMLKIERLIHVAQPGVEYAVWPASARESRA